MDVSKLQRGDVLAAAAGVLLAVAIFIGWYDTDPANPNSKIEGHHTGTFSAWDVHPILRFLLIAAACAPLILAWIIVRQHQLSWPRGELTAIVAITAAVLILYNGVIDRPGEPSATIDLRIGWFLALLGAIGMFAGAVVRSQETGRRRKPPGMP